MTRSKRRERSGCDGDDNIDDDDNDDDDDDVGFILFLLSPEKICFAKRGNKGRKRVSEISYTSTLLCASA
jgi:hypothetical protein